VDDEPEAGQDTAGRHGLALIAVEVEGLFECLPGLLQSALLLGRLSPMLQQRGARRVAGRGKLEGESELPFGLLDVEWERPLTCGAT